jgi:anti-sigma factor RsiW
MEFNGEITMKCLKQNQLQAYMDKEMPAVQAKETKTHLESCARCSRAMEALKSQIRLVRGHLDMLNPKEIEEKPLGEILHHIRTELKTRRRMTPVIRVPVPIMALLVVVLVTMGALLYHQHQKIAALEKYPFMTANAKTTLYVVNEHRIETRALDIDLEGFQPISKPKVYKEKDREPAK